SGLAQGRAKIGGAAILPDDRLRERLAGRLVPSHHRFALIGDADAGDPTCPACGFGHLASAGKRALPDFLRIVLDPARLWIVLRQLGPLGSVQRSGRRGQHRAGGGGARGGDKSERGHASRVPFVSSEVERRACLDFARNDRQGASMALPPRPWPIGRCEHLEPLVRRLLAPNGSPFTYTATQTHLVGGAEGLAIIDPGPDAPEHLAALEAAIAGVPVLAIVCTHTHRDHSPAAAPLSARTGAPIVGCAPLVLESDEPRADVPFDSTYRPNRVLADDD